MKTITLKTKYNDGDLVTVSGEERRMCINVARRYFDLPPIAEIRNKDLRFIIKISDRPSDEAVKIHMQKHPSNDWMEGPDKIVVRSLSDTRWNKTDFYFDTKELLQEMFKYTGKDTLYVTIAEA